MLGVNMDYVPYPADNNPQSQNVQAQAPQRRLLWLQISVSVLVVSLAFGTVYWYGQRYPDQVQSFLISVDRFGITEVGAAEQNRLNTILHLPITYEEKQVLNNRTVFFGATTEMVLLALGQPVCTQKDAQTAPPTEYWVYYIETDRKPTKIAFQNNALVKAEKTSALDTCK